MHLVPFNFGTHEVRTVVINNEPWFVARDIVSVLGYQNPAEAVRDHCKYAKILKASETLSLGLGDAPRGLLIISEPDLYRLAAHSKLPAAVEFEEWVFAEVLPSIRKHGAYMTEETIERAITDPDFLIKLATNLKYEQEQRRLAEAARDEALRTKALIGSKREATAMATASAASRKVATLQVKLDESAQWATVKRMEMLYPEQKFDWRLLKRVSEAQKADVRKVPDVNYGEVNSYHAKVWMAAYGISPVGN